MPPATEDPAIAAERTRLTQQRNELDSAMKQVQLLQARATQLTATLTDRRRAAYAETMFRKSPNVLDPYFWRDVAMALPDYGERLAKLAQDWIALRARSRRPGADHVRCGRARGTADLRDRLHPLVAAAGLHRADR